ncbi:YgaP family membrane protein [Nitrospira sp. Kam-Ns4a]
MSCNLGGVERAIRIALGAGLIVLGYAAGLPGWAAGVAYVVGAVALVTGAVGFCPAWKLFGINTCPAKAEPRGHKAA